jgi:hypothetical protein
MALLGIGYELLNLARQERKLVLSQRPFPFWTAQKFAESACLLRLGLDRVVKVRPNAIRFAITCALIDALKEAFIMVREVL